MPCRHERLKKDRGLIVARFSRDFFQRRESSPMMQHPGRHQMATRSLQRVHRVAQLLSHYHCSWNLPPLGESGPNKVKTCVPNCSSSRTRTENRCGVSCRRPIEFLEIPLKTVDPPWTA